MFTLERNPGHGKECIDDAVKKESAYITAYNDELVPQRTNRRADEQARWRRVQEIKEQVQ